MKELSMQEQSLQVDPQVTIAYRDNRNNGKPALVMLHSLSDNRFAFDAIISAGLSEHFRIIVPDMRGRGRSSHPETGYGLAEHCQDLIALLDAQGIEKAYFAGHSFGGYVALYLAAHFRNRVAGLALIDTATALHPLTPAFVALMTDRLGKWYPNQETYVLKMRAAPFIRYWDADMERSFLADTEILTDDSLIVRTQKTHIAQCAAAVQAVTHKDWRNWATRVPGPSIVLWAKEPFVQGQHIVTERSALETAVLMPGATHQQISGNHITMIFGKGAREIAHQLIGLFVGSKELTMIRH